MIRQERISWIYALLVSTQNSMRMTICAVLGDGKLGLSTKLCKRLRVVSNYPGRLNGPERRVGLCGDATQAPTQWPGFREGERNSPLGPAILARKR